MQPVKTTVRFADIVFDEGLYPRVEGHDPAVVQTYARDLEQIEAAERLITLNADNVLLDGRQRMLAYKKRHAGQTDFEVPVWRYPISSPLESFRLACRLQDRGQALSNDDRVACAKRLYALGDPSQQEIADALGVSRTTVTNWLSRTLKEEKDRKRQAVQTLWQACFTQEEIAARVDVPRQTLAEWLKSFSNESAPKNSGYSPDFTPPLFNVWKQQTKSGGPRHFGNTEIRWLDNLLYLYTDPGAIVVDPFAGSGSMIDLCKKRRRRYFVSDRKPIVEREHEIRRHDLTTGLPKVPQWKNVQLVFLDPPYWKQAEGQYSHDPTDLANMPLETFHDTLARIIDGFAKKLTHAHIALTLQPTQWRAPERQYTDHVVEMLRRVKLPIHMRIFAPYESQQCTAQMVEWAKQHKCCLVLSREIVIWKVQS